MSALLTPQFASVSCAGELVVLELGPVRRSLEFDVALKLSTWLKYNAWVAKVFMLGDSPGKGRYTVGVLHDANAGRPRRKRFAERLPEILRPKGIECGTQSQFVLLMLGSDVVTLPWATARKLSQWLRVRGKEARNNAGEASHWSKIARSDLILAGERPW